jgi:hypothetical protein
MFEELELWSCTVSLNNTVREFINQSITNNFSLDRVPVNNLWLEIQFLRQTNNIGQVPKRRFSGADTLAGFF